MIISIVFIGELAINYFILDDNDNDVDYQDDNNEHFPLTVVIT